MFFFFDEDKEYYPTNKKELKSSSFLFALFIRLWLSSPFRILPWKGRRPDHRCCER